MSTTLGRVGKQVFSSLASPISTSHNNPSQSSSSAPLNSTPASPSLALFLDDLTPTTGRNLHGSSLYDRSQPHSLSGSSVAPLSSSTFYGGSQHTFSTTPTNGPRLSPYRRSNHESLRNSQNFSTNDLNSTSFDEMLKELGEEDETQTMTSSSRIRSLRGSISQDQLQNGNSSSFFSNDHHSSPKSRTTQLPKRQSKYSLNHINSNGNSYENVLLSRTAPSQRQDTQPVDDFPDLTNLLRDSPLKKNSWNDVNERISVAEIEYAKQIAKERIESARREEQVVAEAEALRLRAEKEAAELQKQLEVEKSRAATEDAEKEELRRQLAALQATNARLSEDIVAEKTRAEAEANRLRKEKEAIEAMKAAEAERLAQQLLVAEEARLAAEKRVRDREAAVAEEEAKRAAIQQAADERVATLQAESERLLAAQTVALSVAAKERLEALEAEKEKLRQDILAASVSRDEAVRLLETERQTLLNTTKSETKEDIKPTNTSVSESAETSELISRLRNSAATSATQGQDLQSRLRLKQQRNLKRHVVAMRKRLSSEGGDDDSVSTSTKLPLFNETNGKMASSSRSLLDLIGDASHNASQRSLDATGYEISLGVVSSAFPSSGRFQPPWMMGRGRLPSVSGSICTSPVIPEGTRTEELENGRTIMDIDSEDDEDSSPVPVTPKHTEFNASPSPPPQPAVSPLQDTNNSTAAQNSVEPEIELPPIHVAAAQGNLSAVRTLIIADPSLLTSLDDSLRSPLFYSATNCHTPVTAFLVTQPNAEEIILLPDLYGDSPLHAAAAAGSNGCLSECLQFLTFLQQNPPTNCLPPPLPLPLEDSFTLSTKTEDLPSTAGIHLVSAAKMRLRLVQPDISEESLEWSVEAAVNRPNRVGMTPAHLCASGECLDTLAAVGAGLLATDYNARTPLFVAAAMNRAAAAEYLVNAVDYENGAIMAQDFRGDTALHAAACHGALESLLALLQSGVDPRLENAHALRAVDVAKRNRHHEAVDVLREYAVHYCTPSEFDSVLFLAVLEGQRRGSLECGVSPPPPLIVDPTAGTGNGVAGITRLTSFFSLRAHHPLRVERFGPWLCYSDPSVGRCFWYNSETRGNGQWDRPREIDSVLASAAAAAASSQSNVYQSTAASTRETIELRRVGDWLCYTPADGRTFYYNERAQSFQWENPFIETPINSDGTSDFSQLQTSAGAGTADSQLSQFDQYSNECGADQSAGEWQRYLDDATNAYFWYNHVTQQSQWEDPLELGVGYDEGLIAVENDHDLGI